MNLGDVMDEISTRLDTIAGLRCFAWPNPSVAPPAAVVLYPEEYIFDATYGRGLDRLSLPVVVVVGKVSERSTRDALAAYVNGSGASSVKAVLESGTYTAFDFVRVAAVDFGERTIAGTPYQGAQFTLDIAGSGS